MVKVNLWPQSARDKKDSSPKRVISITPARSQDKQKEIELTKEKSINEIMQELNALVGLARVKKLIFEITAFIAIQKKRQRERLATEPQVLHMIFKGNPGTGKTTVARYLGRLFKEIGVLPKGHLVEVERADLVGEYIGHTAQKTRDMIKKSLGGIMFIDEAYSLARGGEKDFGKEAIDALVKSMEDNKDSLIIILAGYQEEMQYFIDTNPGLRSRFPIQLSFSDYCIGELMDIADMMLKKRQYSLSNAAKEELRLLLERKTRSHAHSGNARLTRNIIERAIRTQAVRLHGNPSYTREELMTITRDDVLMAREEFYS